MLNITTLIRQHVLAVFERHFHVAAFFVAATVAGLFAAEFLLMAAQSWLSRWYQSAVEADLTVAGVLLLVAAAITIMGESVRRSPRPEFPTPVGLIVAAPIAAKIAPKVLNAKVLGVAFALLGAVLIRREFSGK